MAPEIEDNQQRTPGNARTAAENLQQEMFDRAHFTDESGEFPEEDFAAIQKVGLLGALVPTSLGGFGCTFSDYVPIAIALGAANGATALVFNMHASVTGAIALTPDAIATALGASDAWFAARDQLLRDAVAGKRFGVAMSERGAGARLSAMTTTYCNTAEGFAIKGDKTFVSGAGHVDAYLVAAKSEEHPERVSYFIVPGGDGVTVTRTWDSLGMRATCSDDVHFDCLVANEALIGGVEGIALLVAGTMPQWLVASYAAVYVGVAKAAVSASVADLRSRKLTNLASVRARVGRADAATAAAELAVYEAARLVDADPGSRATNKAVYRAKLLAGDTAAIVASSLLEACGTSATRRGNPLERLYRDARCGALQPATSDVCADWLGVAALGGDPEHVESPRW